MKKLFSTFLLLAAASITYAQTNKFIAVGWNTNNAPVGSVPFVRSATSNGWTAGAPGESYFLSASNNTTPYPHFQPIYGSNIVGGVASAGSSNVFLVVSNLTVTNTWVTANITDSNITTVASVTANGNPYDIRWDTHFRIEWDGNIEATVRIATWFTYTDIFGVVTTNMMYDVLPNSQRYESYHIESTYSSGGNARPDVGLNIDYGWTAGSAFFMPKSNTSITISALRVGSTIISTGGATNVANYYFTSIGNGSGSSSSGSSGSASNVFFLDSPSISWSQVGGSNYAQVTTSLTNAWQNYTLAASNSVTSVMTNLFNTTSNILWASKVTTNTPLTLLSTNQGSSLSNTVDLIAGSFVTIVTNANKRSFTISSTATDSAGITNNLFPTPPQVPATIWSDWNTPIVLLTNGNSIQDSNHLSEATIGNIGSKMALYYSSYDGGYTGRIWAAYGDLYNGFTKYGVVLAPTAGTWDSGSIGGATHYRENGTNYLYYFGTTNFGAFEAEPLHIGVAYSTDGTNYTKYASNPILRTNDVGGTCITLYTFFPKKVGTTNYYGYFNAKHSSGDAQEKIHMARATNPLGPWTYYGYIYYHTNSTVTSDFTVADLPSGGYIAAYWKGGGVGDPATATAYSDDLIHWTAAGTLINGPAFGTRLWYDNGIALSYCQVSPNNTVYYTRPKLSNLGSISVSQISSPLIFGSGTFITNVAANSARELVSTVGIGTTALGAAFDDSDYYWWSFAGNGTAPTNTFDWGYSISRDTFFTAGTLEMNGSLLTNAVDLIAGSNITITTNANKRSFTLTSTGGSGIATNGGTGINNRFTNTVFAGTIGFSNDVTIAGNIAVAGTFNVGTTTSTNFFISSQSNGVAYVQSDGSVVATNRWGGQTNFAAIVVTNANQANLTRLLLNGAQNGALGEVVSYYTNGLRVAFIDTSGNAGFAGQIGATNGINIGGGAVSITASAANINVPTTFKVKTVAKTTSTTLTTTTEAWAYLNNSGAGAAVTNTLPASAVGLGYHGSVVASQIFCFKAAGSDVIRYAGTVTGAAGGIYASTPGMCIELVCDVAGTWTVHSVQAIYTAGAISTDWTTF